MGELGNDSNVYFGGVTVTSSLYRFRHGEHGEEDEICGGIYIDDVMFAFGQRLVLK